MKEIVLSVCVAAVATGIFGLLMPKSSFKKQISFLSVSFLILSVFNSISGGSFSLDELYDSFKEKSVYVDFSKEAEAMTKREIAAVLCRNIRELLEKNSVEFEDVFVIIDISEDSRISIKQIRLVFNKENADNMALAEKIVKREVGYETQIVSEVIS